MSANGVPMRGWVSPSATTSMRNEELHHENIAYFSFFHAAASRVGAAAEVEHKPLFYQFQ